MRRRALRLMLLALAALVSSDAFAGEVLFERAFGGGERKPATFEETLDLPSGRSPYLINVVNGQLDGDHRVSSLRLFFDGIPVLGPNDLDQRTEAVNRAIEPGEDNRLTLELKGSRDAFVLVRILGGVAGTEEPPPVRNTTQTNADQTLDALNMGDGVAFWFAREESAESYVLYVATTSEGPWQAIQRIEADDLPPVRIPKTVDLGGETLDGTERTETALFRERTLYYRMEVLDSGGNLVREYPVVTLPPFASDGGEATARRGSRLAPTSPS